jgi:hypothetical protein
VVAGTHPDLCLPTNSVQVKGRVQWWFRGQQTFGDRAIPLGEPNFPECSPAGELQQALRADLRADSEPPPDQRVIAWR